MVTTVLLSSFNMLLLLLLSHFSRVRLCATPETAALQAPPSLGVSRQEHWSGLPFPSPVHESEKWKGSRSVLSDSSRPHGLQPTRLLHPWDFPGKSTGVGCHRLLHSGGQLEFNPKGNQSVSPKGNQPWIFIGRTDAEAEAPILWSPTAKGQLIGKDPDVRKDWGQEKRGAT